MLLFLLFYFDIQRINYNFWMLFFFKNNKLIIIYNLIMDFHILLMMCFGFYSTTHGIQF